jgi:hypothetical protein
MKVELALAADVGWAETFLWLIKGAEQPSLIREAAMEFVNSKRKPFQEECTPRSRLLFQYNSDVNDWAVIWGTVAHLNYLGYSQGYNAAGTPLMNDIHLVSSCRE